MADSLVSCAARDSTQLFRSGLMNEVQLDELRLELFADHDFDQTSRDEKFATLRLFSLSHASTFVDHAA